MILQKTAFTSLFLVCFFIACFQSYGQDFIIGAGIGSGYEVIQRISDKEINTKHTTNQAGVDIEFSPFYSHLFIVSGAYYSMCNLGEKVMIPMLVRITLGSKAQVYGEGGAYYNLTMYDSPDKYNAHDDIGMKTGTGLIFKLNKRWRILLGYSYTYGFTKAYSEEVPLPLQQIQVEDYIRKSRGINLSVKYRF